MTIKDKAVKFNNPGELTIKKFFLALAWLIWCGPLLWVCVALGIGHSLHLGVLIFTVSGLCAIGVVISAGIMRPPRLGGWLRRHPWVTSGVLLPILAGSITGTKLAANWPREQAAQAARDRAIRVRTETERRATAIRHARLVAQEEAEIARFNAMTPVEHLSAARTAWSARQEEGRWGWRHHLQVADRRGALTLLTEIQATQAREERLVQERARETARAEAENLQFLRRSFAETLEGTFIRNGLEVGRVRATGREANILNIAYPLCGRVFIQRVVTDLGSDLRRRGFTRVRCSSYFASAWQNL